ncbi:Tom7-domain-containing protein [Dissoconium aciculare CBS 342.82]|uniref:Tom7-domain-containing protein n=1 Tax=Dissoconium aciculare CBS 342.82 TaxID=1314786 RepID=A0A6J3M438_9PEZI|nr:Tom7-domain-containing protein [Dissoconium aciculare CBS 342.82]KAF1822663.1 Tom7-domain-containing protein [Dissoconium aciculare CBS 342.82]
MAWLTLSEESKERISRVIDFSRIAVHYGYLPLIIYLGYTKSNPRPSLIRYVSPSAAPSERHHMKAGTEQQRTDSATDYSHLWHKEYAAICMR